MDIEWLGPYQIVGKLGRGGMGTVYQGVHRETAEPAAVKLLSAMLAEEEGFRARFEGEIETLRKLNHPNIVRLFGFGQQEGHLFYAMELVEGNSLEEELRRGRRFDWREVARIGVETCRALRHAHDRGVIHRDIKPGNLLLATDGRVKLSDFGIARLFGNSRLTSAGNVVGTAEYMAPEQAEGRPVDARSDLYSLGSLLYALLARRPVFRGNSLPEVLHKQRFEQPEPLRKHASDAPEEFERILSELLEKEPARRIPNANLLGRRLEAMLHALSVSPQTAEANANWFLEDEPSSESEAVKLPILLDDTTAAPTLDRPVGEPPVTEALSEQKTQKPILRDSSTAENIPTKTARETTPQAGHFVVVSEEELDAVQTEEPLSAIISWHTWALATALILVGMSIWWFLQPPTADALYERIAARMDAGSGDSLPRTQSEIDEIKSVMNDFIVHYPNDARAERLRAYEKELDLRLLELRFDQQIRGRRRTDDLLPIEQMYLEAISSIRLNPTRAMTQLQSLVDLYSQPGDKTGSTEQCLTLAQRRLVQLRKEVEKLAAGQLALLQERLSAADMLRQSNPKQARKMYQAIVELYGDKPWAADTVRQARQKLKLNTKPTSQP